VTKTVTADYKIKKHAGGMRVDMAWHGRQKGRRENEESRKPEKLPGEVIRILHGPRKS
jgi:hypothetical protein